MSIHNHNNHGGKDNLPRHENQQEASRPSKASREQQYKEFCELIKQGYTEDALAKKLGMKKGSPFHKCLLSAMRAGITAPYDKIVIHSSEFAESLRDSLGLDEDSFIALERTDGRWTIGEALP